MNNPHAQNAQSTIKAADRQHAEQAMALLAQAQVEATLAVAYELKTANLLKLFQRDQTKTSDPIAHALLVRQIADRLGVRETK